VLKEVGSGTRDNTPTNSTTSFNLRLSSRSYTWNRFFSLFTEPGLLAAAGKPLMELSVIKGGIGTGTRSEMNFRKAGDWCRLCYRYNIMFILR
jgi:hypothetical protein